MLEFTGIPMAPVAMGALFWGFSYKCKKYVKGMELKFNDSHSLGMRMRKPRRL